MYTRSSVLAITDDILLTIRCDLMVYVPEPYSWPGERHGHEQLSSNLMSYNSRGIGQCLKPLWSSNRTCVFVCSCTHMYIKRVCENTSRNALANVWNNLEPQCARETTLNYNTYAIQRFADKFVIAQPTASQASWELLAQTEPRQNIILLSRIAKLI